MMPADDPTVGQPPGERGDDRERSLVNVVGLRVKDVRNTGAKALMAHISSYPRDVLAVSAQGADAGIYTPQNLLRFIAQLGLDVRAFDACLSDASVARAVQDETAAGKGDGMAAGPVVIVSAGGSETDRFAGPLDSAAILTAIDAAAKP